MIASILLRQVAPFFCSFLLCLFYFLCNVSLNICCLPLALFPVVTHPLRVSVLNMKLSFPPHPFSNIHNVHLCSGARCPSDAPKQRKSRRLEYFLGTFLIDSTTAHHEHHDHFFKAFLLPPSAPPWFSFGRSIA